MVSRKFLTTFAWLRYLTVLAMVLGSIFMMKHAPEAQAQNEKPSFYTEEPVDKTKVDKPIRTAIEYLLYFVMGLGLVSVAAGLLMSLPLIGKKEKGIEVIKGSLITIAVAAVFWLLVALFGSVLTI